MSVIDGHIYGSSQSAIHLSAISPACFVICPLICSPFTWLFQVPVCPSTCMSTILGSMSLSVILCWFHVDFRYFCELWAILNSWFVHHNSILIKIQLDATVCSLIYFTAKSLYMFRVSTAPIIRSTKNCNRSLRYRSQYRYSYFPSTWREVAVATYLQCGQVIISV